uniref:Uncharacterized protein n=1 Tax=Strombidium inclinatum TaxID=197538 RepID=A0A7S3IZF2_9SPIT|mmetsp:Transcript_8569/g.13236  ORF Transcript_8569/g.13236 Transcript_8569/m.13236 type:complete len:101 (+) Transcript_8569:261-563(+)
MKRHQFMNPYPNNQQQSKRPTALSIFPHVGMITKERNYETQKKRSELGVSENPMGIDVANTLKFYNHTNNEIKLYKNESIKVKDMLIKRKYVSKKGDGKK